MSIRGASASWTIKILSPGIQRIGIDVGLAGQRMEAVENQRDRRVVGATYDFPGVAVIVDMAAPGKRFEANAHAALAARSPSS